MNNYHINLLKILLFVCMFVMISCKQNCDPPEYGRYLAEMDDDVKIYIDLKKDGTFTHHYVDKQGKSKNHVGKWRFIPGKNTCEILFDPWYEYGFGSKFNRPDEKVIMFSHYRNGVIEPYDDIPPIYKKQP